VKPSYDANTILLLDDDFDNIALFMLALEKQGFHVVGFTKPLLALEHFQKNFEKYGLVISNIKMPVMNGYQFIKQIKEIKPQVKVFFISASEINYVEVRTELPFLDINEFIEIPISLEGLCQDGKQPYQ
jgi:CheY-like chemotaxis protein